MVTSYKFNDFNLTNNDDGNLITINGNIDKKVINRESVNENRSSVMKKLMGTVSEI